MNATARAILDRDADAAVKLLCSHPARYIHPIEKALIETISTDHAGRFSRREIFDAITRAAERRNKARDRTSDCIDIVRKLDCELQNLFLPPALEDKRAKIVGDTHERLHVGFFEAIIRDRATHGIRDDLGDDLAPLIERVGPSDALARALDDDLVADRRSHIDGVIAAARKEYARQRHADMGRAKVLRGDPSAIETVAVTALGNASGVFKADRRPRVAGNGAIEEAATPKTGSLEHSTRKRLMRRLTDNQKAALRAYESAPSKAAAAAALKISRQAFEDHLAGIRGHAAKLGISLS